MNELRVLKPGMLTTVQDLGRWGFQSQGVPVAGPMDACAHRLANALVGNLRTAATLEVTLIGPHLEFADTRRVAIAGARFELRVDGNPMEMHSPMTIAAGSRLTFGSRLNGARAYVAVEGGIDVPPVLGSRATHVTSGMGGFHGRALQAGDRIPLGLPLVEGPPKGRHHVLKDPSEGGHDNRERGPVLRILPGPYEDLEVLRGLQAAPYTIDQNSDRMGFRLGGAPLRATAPADLISDATPMGAIQLTPSGLPILLMADRQTTGGYPHIATVITADLPRAGQLAPGDSLSFATCSIADAMAALIAQERSVMAAEGRDPA